MADPTGNIGALNITVGADYSKMSQALGQAQSQAATAGANISSALNQGIKGAEGLTGATTRAAEGVWLLEKATQAEAAGQAKAAAAVKVHSAALHGMVTEVQATSASIRVLEGSSALRAVERFVATTLGIGPAMQAIFPIVGAIAFAEILAKIGGEIKAFFDNASQGKERVGGAFRELNTQLETTVDEIQLANDKLDNQIAKLTGKRQNALKEMIDEAAVAVDRLGEKLDAALGKLVDLLKKEEIGLFQALLTGQGVTNPGAIPGVGMFTGTGKPEAGRAEQLGGKTGVGGERQRIEDIKDRARAEIKAASESGDLNRSNNAILKARFELQLAYMVQLQAQGSELAKLQALQKKGFSDESTNIEVAKKAYRDLANQRDLAIGEIENLGKRQTVTKLESDNSGVKLAEQAARDQISEWEKEDANRKAHNQLTLRQEEKLWEDRLAIAKAGQGAFAGLPQVKRPGIETQADFVREIDTKSAKAGTEANRKSEADAIKYEAGQWKLLEEAIKEAQEIAARGGGFGEAQAKLQILMDAAVSDAQAFPELIAHILDAIPDAQREADKESLTELHQFLAESETAFKDSAAKQGSVAQPEELRSRLEGIIRAYTTIPSVVAKARQEIAGLDKQIAERALKLTELGAVNTAAAGEADVQARKVALQSAYDLQVTHTAQQQITLARQLADEDARGLQIKLEKADADVQAARIEKDTEKIKRAENEQAAAQRAIDAQAGQAAAAQAKLKFDESPGVQIARGLNANISSVGQNLASSFGNAVANHGKIGQVFRDAMKQLESGAISTIMGQAIKRGLEASGIDKLISGAMEKIFGKAKDTVAQQQVNMTRMQTSATHTLTTSTDRLTQAIQQLTAQIQPNTTATTDDTAAVKSTAAGQTAVSAALGANTVATWVNTAAMAVQGIMSLFTGGGGGGSISGSAAAGGEPKAGEPWIVGEKGPELFIPKTAGTVIPNDKTRAMLSQLSVPKLSIALPDAPAVFSRDATGQAAGGGTSGDTIANNHNVGHVGDNHFNIYDVQKPREAVRSLADFMKRQTGKYSPANS